jgi:hypothetical protein
MLRRPDPPDAHWLRAYTKTLRLPKKLSMVGRVRG